MMLLFIFVIAICFLLMGFPLKYKALLKFLLMLWSNDLFRDKISFLKELQFNSTDSYSLLKLLFSWIIPFDRYMQISDGNIKIKLFRNAVLCFCSGTPPTFSSFLGNMFIHVCLYLWVQMHLHIQYVFIYDMCVCLL